MKKLFGMIFIVIGFGLLSAFITDYLRFTRVISVESQIPITIALWGALLIAAFFWRQIVSALKK